MTHKTAKFKGGDWSTGHVRENQPNGSLSVSWNHPNGEESDIAFDVSDCFDQTRSAFVVLHEAEARALLEHLNELLGRPYTYPAFAGMAPSAD